MDEEYLVRVAKALKFIESLDHLDGEQLFELEKILRGEQMRALNDCIKEDKEDKEDNEEVVMSYYEYKKLVSGLEPYKQFKQTKPLAEAIERTLNLFTVYV